MASATLTKMRIYPWALLHPGVPALKDIGQLIASSIEAQRRVAAKQKALLEQDHKQQDQTRQDESGDDADDTPSPGLSPAEIAELQKESLDALLPVLRLEGMVFLATGYDGLDGQGLDVNAALPQSAEAAVGNIHVTMAKLHIDAIDRAVGGANAVEGLVEDLGPAGKFSADRASIGKMMLRDTAMRLLNGDPLSMQMLDGARFGPVEFDAMAVTMPTGGTVRIDKIALLETSFDHSFLSSFGFSVSGFKVNAADMDPRGREGLRQFGLKSISANLGLAFQWDADKKTAALRDVAFSVAELGSLQFNADLVNVDPAAGTQGMPGLGKATLRYQDRSLINRLLTASADGKPKAAQLRQMREAYAANLLGMLGPLAADPKLADSIKALADFAKTPKNLTVTLAPPAPVPLAAVKEVAAQGPQALVDLFGLSVTANQ